MSYRVLQLSPQASTRVTRRRIAVQDSWGARSAPSLDLSLDTEFLRSWFECDPDFDQGNAYDRTNFGVISGLALSVAVSASFWAGVGWIVARVWR
jgi:hypothetical protein